MVMAQAHGDGPIGYSKRMVMAQAHGDGPIEQHVGPELSAEQLPYEHCRQVQHGSSAAHLQCTSQLICSSFAVHLQLIAKYLLLICGMPRGSSAAYLLLSLSLVAGLPTTP